MDALDSARRMLEPWTRSADVLFSRAAAGQAARAAKRAGVHRGGGDSWGLDAIDSGDLSTPGAAEAEVDLTVGRELSLVLAQEGERAAAQAHSTAEPASGRASTLADPTLGLAEAADVLLRSGRRILGSSESTPDSEIAAVSYPAVSRAARRAASRLVAGLRRSGLAVAGSSSRSCDSGGVHVGPMPAALMARSSEENSFSAPSEAAEPAPSTVPALTTASQEVEGSRHALLASPMHPPPRVVTSFDCIALHRMNDLAMSLLRLLQMHETSEGPRRGVATETPDDLGPLALCAAPLAGAVHTAVVETGELAASAAEWASSGSGRCDELAEAAAGLADGVVVSRSVRGALGVGAVQGGGGDRGAGRSGGGGGAEESGGWGGGRGRAVLDAAMLEAGVLAGGAVELEAAGGEAAMRCVAALEVLAQAAVGALRAEVGAFGEGEGGGSRAGRPAGAGAVQRAERSCRCIARLCKAVGADCS